MTESSELRIARAIRDVVRQVVAAKPEQLPENVLAARRDLEAAVAEYDAPPSPPLGRTATQET